MKKLAKINIRPGIDWTKETLVLETPAGVEHCAVADSERSEHYIKVEQQWSGGAYAIRDCGEYLSIKFYHVAGDFSRVGAFQKNVTSGAHIGLVPAVCNGYCWSYNYDHTERNYDTDHELRIYKDRTLAFVHAVVVDGKIIYYISTEQGNKKYQRYDWINENIQALLNNTDIHIVHDDDEIRALAYKLTKKEAGFLHVLYQDSWSDVTTRYIANYNSYQFGYFSQATQELVNNFFGYRDSSTAYLRSSFEKEWGKNINCLRKVMVWCYLREAATLQALNKEDRAKFLLEGLEEYWDNPEDHHNEAIWARKNDDIILVIPNQRGTTSWGYGSQSKKLFAYNIKTKTRFYGECDHNGTWSFPIPSLDYILTAMYLGRHRVYENISSDSYIVTPKTTIVGGVSARQLFDGSNIAWILDNTHGECRILDEENYEYSSYSGSEEEARKKPIDVRTFLSDDKIGTIALSILVTTGIPMLEQLLKSKLFNMYFTALEDKSENHRNCSEIFWDDDKKRASSGFEREYSAFTYHGKEKNLKKMFGLSLNALREIDKLMQFTKMKEQAGRVEYEAWERPIPKMAGMAEALGADLSTIDPTTFARCLALCKPGVRHSHRYYGGRNSVWSIVGDTVHTAIGNSATPKQVIGLLEHYTDCLEEYKDYLNMREQLKNIQSMKPDIPDVFSERRYPVKPGAAKRFIPFLDGMPNTARPWMHTNFTAETFTEHYSYTYREAAERGDFHVIKEDENLLGILIEMTPAENLKYLHDEAAYWVGFYQDTAKDVLFSKAAQRVVPLEWKDNEMGLCIVAPKSVRDLKNEGSVLSHCVASYVDPIIGGKENIMFLRRTDMPESPFYTVEVLDSGEIRQVHCYGNGNLTSEGQRNAFARSGYKVYDHDYDIVKFLTAWSKAMKGKVKASSIKSAYGALCALR